MHRPPYYTLDENGDIDHLILHEVTGDTLTYAYITRAESSVNNMNVSGSYTYLLDGQSYSISGSVAYNVSVGGAVLLYEDGELSSIQQLEDVTLTQLSTLYAMAGNQKYLLADDVQVLLRDTSLSGGLYATTLDQINDEDYTLKGWYDDQGFPRRRPHPHPRRHAPSDRPAQIKGTAPPDTGRPARVRGRCYNAAVRHRTTRREKTPSLAVY